MKNNIDKELFIFFINLCNFVHSISQALKYSIKEESVVGYLIGNIKTDSQLSEKNVNPLLFQLYEDEEMKRYFKIIEHTGECFVAGRIDRETICSFKEVGEIDPQKIQNCKLSLTVFVPKERWINVEINIQDINDHFPIFEPKWKIIEIDERVSVNFEIPLTHAKDLDIGINNIQGYSLEDKTGIFGLKYERPFTLNLVLKSKLDYDVTEGKNYTLKLTACDGGYPPQCGHQDLHIRVNDHNDNAPVFMKSEYMVNVSENTVVGTEVFKVNATDKDSGVYGSINYYMYESMNIPHKSADIPYFKISKNCGRIILNRKLNAKTNPSFFIRLEAHDSGESPLIGQSIMKIMVEDVNDHIPQISIKPKSDVAGCMLFTFENNEKNSYIGLIVVTDGDLNLNGKVSCKLRQGDQKILLKVSNDGEDRMIYSIMANYSFDAEEEDLVRIIVICKDHGTPSQSAVQAIDICIIDLNEYEPVIDRTVTIVNVSEDIQVGNDIFSVKVDDRDATRNFSFSLQENVNKYFSIDKKYGKIKTKLILDREKVEKFVLGIIVEDNKQSGKQFTASFSLTVSIIDVNDNKPYLMNSSRTVNILEGSYDVKEKLFQVHAVDDDLGDNAKIEFTINYLENQNEKVTDKIFTIDRNSGEVFALKTLDREKYNYFKISLLLTDKGNPPQTKEEIIMVKIIDRNDNEPIWIFPSLEKNVINVTKIIYPGQIITTVQAQDYDTLENGNVTYSLLNVESNQKVNVFKVHETKGTVQVTEFLTAKIFVLHLQASDNGKIPLKSKVMRLTLRYWPMETGSLLSGNDSISFTLIITMAIVTCLICMSLLVAIIIVRRRQTYNYPHDQNPNSVMFAVNSDQNRSQFISLRNDPFYFDQSTGGSSILSNKWSLQYESKNDYMMSLERNKIISPDFQTNTLGEPLLQAVPSMRINSPREVLVRKKIRNVNGDLDCTIVGDGMMNGFPDEEKFHSEFLKNNDFHYPVHSNLYSTFTNNDQKQFIDNMNPRCPQMRFLPSTTIYGYHLAENPSSITNDLPENKNACLPC